MSGPRLEGNRLHMTNDYSIISKYSASKRGYFVDPALESCIEHLFKDNSKLYTRRTAQVNLGYAARQLAVKKYLNASIETHGFTCVIILGAGYDTLSLRHIANSSLTHWFEIDLPSVIEAKRNYIKQASNADASDISVSSDENVISFHPLRLHLISCDLRNTTELIERLSLAIKTVPLKSRVLILNEVCLCYLERSEVEVVLESIRNFLKDEQFDSMHYMGFQQLKPPGRSPFGQLMSNHFREMSFPLGDFPTKQNLVDLFAKLKFRKLSVIPMYHIFHNDLMLRHSDEKFRDIEPFDEYEEFDLYLSHYAIVCAHSCLQGDCFDEEDEESKEKSYEYSAEEVMNMKVDQTSKLEVRLRHTDCHTSYRYGQASCLLEDNSGGGIALFTGGYGHLTRAKTSHSHGSLRRLDDCVLLNWDKVTDDFRTEKLHIAKQIQCDPEILLGRMHGQVCPLENNLVFFSGGRRSPKRISGAIGNSFIGRINKSELRLDLVDKIMIADDSLRWRHRTLKLNRDQLIQVGGINGSLSAKHTPEGPIGLWNLSSDRFGFFCALDYQVGQTLDLDRHSFGADLRDENSLMVFGGLVHSLPFDRPISSAKGVLLIDLRHPHRPTEIECSTQGYDLHVHFLDDYQFIRYGGISTTTGLPEDLVHLFDLRQSNNGLPVASFGYSENTELDFIPTKMTSVHFKQSRKIISLGGGGTYFTFGSQFNKCHQTISYDAL